jgi:proton-translocating NADH-quinone oxidoreductase chain N
VNAPVFVWVVSVPLAAAPLAYLVGRLSRQPAAARWVCLLGLAATWGPLALAVQRFARVGTETHFIGAVPLQWDGLAQLLAVLALVLGSLVAIFSCADVAGEPGEEKYHALLLAMVGVLVGLGCAADLFNLWLWLEALAVSTYLLVAYHTGHPASLEAAVKYLVQSAMGTLLVLLGIALVLMQTGRLDLAGVAASAQAADTPALVAAGALFVVGFGVKAALVPLHTWLPDAHAQAPSGVSAALSGVVIAAGLVALLRAVAPLAGEARLALDAGFLFMTLGAVNMLYGNLLALRQTNVKRLLAFSSLSHIGYMLFGVGITLYAGQAGGAQGGFFHLLTHGLMKGLAFLAAGALLYALSAPGTHAPLRIADLAGAARRFPLVAVALSLAVLGLAGLPPLAGFASKWQIFAAGFSTHSVLVAVFVVFAAANSVLSLAYYAPLINMLYRHEAAESVWRARPMPPALQLPVGALALAIVLIGVWPSLLQGLTVPAASALLALRGGP